jgi:hypothetical protein
MTTRGYTGKRIASRHLYGGRQKIEEKMERAKVNEEMQLQIVAQMQQKMMKHQKVEPVNRQCDVCIMM